MKVLVADDDPSSVTLLELLLQRWGYEVIAASNGRQAIAALCQEDGPRLAIVDWVMPEADGLQVLREVGQSPARSSAYIILLTGKAQKDDVVAGLEAGADDYVLKPFDKDELRARVAVGKRVVELNRALSARVTELEQAAAHIKNLQGLLPICAYCHRIRDDSADWQRLEVYIENHSTARFSHGMCPECFEKNFGSEG